MCGGVLLTCLSVAFICDVRESQKKVLYFLELELQMVVSLCMGSGNRNWFSEGATGALS